MTLEEIWGNEQAKRAVEIAEKGRHSIKFIGGSETEMFHTYCIEKNLKAFAVYPCLCGNFGDNEKACTCEIEELNRVKKEIGKLETDLTVYTERPRKLGNLPYQLDSQSRQLLEQAMKTLQLDQKTILGVLQVAKTIAGLDHETKVKAQHIAEALQYRERR